MADEDDDDFYNAAFDQLEQVIANRNPNSQTPIEQFVTNQQGVSAPAVVNQEGATGYGEPNGSGNWEGPSHQAGSGYSVPYTTGYQPSDSTGAKTWIS